MQMLACYLGSEDRTLAPDVDVMAQGRAMTAKKALFGKLPALAATIFSLLAPAVVSAGDAWDPGTKGGTPAPLVRSRLVLEREEVVFKGGEVTGRFRVRNPDPTALRATMGFPVDYASRERFDPATLADSFLNDLTAPLHVIIANHEAEPVGVRDETDHYPFRYTWDMTFPGNGAAEFTVSYPMQPFVLAEEGGGGVKRSEFSFTPRADGYGSKTVKAARFDYCDARLVRALARFPEGGYETWSADGLTVAYTEWRIAPAPYRLDEQKGCIVWERSNWQPRRDTDDIRVAVEKSSQSFAFSCTRNDCNGLARMQAIWDNWCGTGPVGGKRQFAETVNLTTQPLPADFHRLEFLAYRHSHDLSAAENPQIYLPAHLETDFQLALLRYLRNYIAAAHGQRFRDQQLAACYRDVPQMPAWTPAERQNLEVIRSLESSITKENQLAWKQLRGERGEER